MFTSLIEVSHEDGLNFINIHNFLMLVVGFKKWWEVTLFCDLVVLLLIFYLLISMYYFVNL